MAPERALRGPERVRLGADPSIGFVVDSGTVFAGVEDLVLLLERGTAGNRLTVTVKLAQEQEWLADRSREVTFATGEAHASLLIPAGDFNENVTRSGDLTATLDDVSGYETVSAKATVLVISSEGPLVTYALSQPSYAFEEGAGPARTQLVARMASGMPRAVTVGAFLGTRGNDVAGSGFTATPGEDYERVGGSVFLGASEYELEGGRWVGRTDVLVPLLDDDVREGAETFELNLRPLPRQSGKVQLVNPDGSMCGSRCRHVIRIIDDEELPALDFSVSPGAIMEAGETSATATVSITDDKSFAADQAVTLMLEGTASRGADYVVSPADADAATANYQVNLPANARSVDVTFRAMDDGARDPNERIDVRAMHEGDAVGAMQTIRIIDRGTVDIDVAQSSVVESAGSVSYTVTALTGGDMQPEPGFSMEVPVRTVNGSAYDEGDFRAVSTTLAFARADFSRAEVAAGSGDYRWVASKQGEVAIVDEEVVEREEVFTIALDAPPASSGFVLGMASAEVAIANDDRWGFLVEVSPQSIREGEEAEVTLTLSVVDKTGRATADGHCVAEFPVFAQLVPGGTASNGNDYTYTVTGRDLPSLRLAGCQPSTRMTLHLHALTDDESEDDEILAFAPVFVGTSGGVDPDPGLNRAGSLRIENGPGPLKVSFSRSSYTFGEDSPDAAALIVARSDAGALGGAAVDLKIRSRNGTAVSGADYGPVDESVTLAAQDYALENGVWVARHRLALRLLDDEMREDSESFDLILERAPGGSTDFRLSTFDGARCPDPCAHPVHITDEEDIPDVEVSIDAANIGEENESSTTVTVSITNGKTFAADQVFTINFEGTAVEGIDFVVSPADADRAIPGHQVILPGGSTSIVVTIRAVDDGVEDPDEEFSLSVDIGGRSIDGGSVRISNRPMGPKVEITFEEVLPSGDGRDAGIATGPFRTRFSFSEPVEGFSQEDIVWQTHAGTTVESTNIGVLLWGYTEVRAGVEYTAEMMPTQNGRLYIVVKPGAAQSVAEGHGNQLGAGSLRVELPKNRMMIAPAELTVGEGDRHGAEFGVLLTSEPTGPVTVAVTGAEGTNITVDRPVLTFGRAHWNSGQGVTVTASRDANTADERVRLHVSASGGGYDGQTADLVINVRDGGSSASADAPEDQSPGLLGDVTPEVAAAALFGEQGLSEAQLAALDRLGNRNGRYDLGDVLAWVARCRRDGASCGEGSSPAPALPAGTKRARSNNRRRRVTRRCGDGRNRAGRGCRRPKRAQPVLALLAVVMLTSACDRGSGLMEPLIADPDPDPGFMRVELRVPADARDLGAWLAVEGPDIGAVRTPGLEWFETDGTTGKGIIVAGALSTGPLLEFHVPDRRLRSQYRVRLIQVTGEDYAARDVSAYTARISR